MLCPLLTKGVPDPPSEHECPNGQQNLQILIEAEAKYDSIEVTRPPQAPPGDW